MSPGRIGAQQSSTVDSDELAHFSRLAGQWWDARGPWATLHRFNPVRLAFIRDRAATHFSRNATRLDSLSGLRLLDIGCGGGVLSEPLARLGATVVGVDPAVDNIAAAQHHARQAGLAIDYRCATAEALVERGEVFDMVLAMEVVEHVANFNLFIAACAGLVKPGGLFFVATINRTLKSFALLIVGAEYILRWIPRGTHQWDKFITPDELESSLERSGLRLLDESGVIYNLFADRFQLSTDMDANYMLVAEKSA